MNLITAARRAYDDLVSMIRSEQHQAAADVMVAELEDVRVVIERHEWIRFDAAAWPRLADGDACWIADRAMTVPQLAFWSDRVQGFVARGKQTAYPGKQITHFAIAAMPPMPASPADEARARLRAVLANSPSALADLDLL